MNIKLISDVIVKRRKTLAVSQKEVAELAHLSLHSIHNLESGTGNPTIASLLAILDVLGMEVTLSVKDALRMEEAND